MINSIFDLFIYLFNVLATNEIFISYFAFIVVGFIIALIWNLIRYKGYV